MTGRRGVYPGSFNPLTVAHLAIADAAFHTARLERLDLAISRAALGKDDIASSRGARLDAIARATTHSNRARGRRGR